jgi:hypothetical protein
MALDMRSTERLAIVSWLEERVDEMRPDRSSIKEEYGCDLVLLLDVLRLDLTVRDARTKKARVKKLKAVKK